MCVSPYLGIGCRGRSPHGLVHNLFFTLYSSKIEIFKTRFFDVMTTHIHVKHVLGFVYVFLALFGHRVPGWGGGSLFEVHCQRQ